MHAILDQLVMLAHAHGDVFYFNPPLTPAAIQATLAGAALPSCAALVQLYTWANGTDYAWSDPFFRDRAFISLEYALDIHMQLVGWAEEFAYRGLELNRAVPFGYLHGQSFVLYVGEVGLLHQPILSIGDTLTIEYADPAALLATCIAWWRLPEPETEPRDLSGPTWYAQNTVAGDPQYIDRLNQSRVRWIDEPSIGIHEG